MSRSRSRSDFLISDKQLEGFLRAFIRAGYQRKYDEGLFYYYGIFVSFDKEKLLIRERDGTLKALPRQGLIKFGPGYKPKERMEYGQGQGKEKRR